MVSPTISSSLQSVCLAQSNLLLLLGYRPSSPQCSHQPSGRRAPTQASLPQVSQSFCIQVKCLSLRPQHQALLLLFLTTVTTALFHAFVVTCLTSMYPTGRGHRAQPCHLHVPNTQCGARPTNRTATLLDQSINMNNQFCGPHSREDEIKYVTKHMSTKETQTREKFPMSGLVS